MKARIAELFTQNDLNEFVARRALLLGGIQLAPGVTVPANLRLGPAFGNQTLGETWGDVNVELVGDILAITGPSSSTFGTVLPDGRGPQNMSQELRLGKARSKRS